MENAANLVREYNKAVETAKIYKMTLEPDMNGFKIYWYNTGYEHRYFDTIKEVTAFLKGGILFLELRKSNYTGISI